MTGSGAANLQNSPAQPVSVAVILLLVDSDHMVQVRDRKRTQNDQRSMMLNEARVCADADGQEVSTAVMVKPGDFQS